MSYQRLIEISTDLISEASKYTYSRENLLTALAPLQKNVVILKGARGIGKSTAIQQFLLKKQHAGSKVFYICADSTLLDVKLAELAQDYYKRSGEYLAIDEIHKYNGWQAEVKTILDSFPKLKLIVSGSSSLSLDYAATDLSRRHIMLHAKGLSFREYINKKYGLNLEICSLLEIFESGEVVTSNVVKTFNQKKLDLIELFHEYLKDGYFIARDNYTTNALYYDSLINSVNSIIDSDISSVHKDIDSVSKQNIKLLLKHIANKCPFTPNISELSRHLGIINDNTLKKYLYYLHEGEVLINLYSHNKSHKDFQKPQKILLNNTNFSYAFSQEPTIGTIRETFVANCLASQGKLTAPPAGDFCLNDKWYLEVGGKNKDKRQIKSMPNSYVLSDNILSFKSGHIPLWALGFLW